MKSTGTIEAGTGLWRDPNAGATNESAFTAQAGGFRNDNGVFLNLSSFGYWWSRTSVSPSFAVNRVLHYDIDDVSAANNSKANGYSVRCVKD